MESKADEDVPSGFFSKATEEEEKSRSSSAATSSNGNNDKGCSDSADDAASAASGSASTSSGSVDIVLSDSGSTGDEEEEGSKQASEEGEEDGYVDVERYTSPDVNAANDNETSATAAAAAERSQIQGACSLVSASTDGKPLKLDNRPSPAIAAQVEAKGEKEKLPGDKEDDSLGVKSRRTSVRQKRARLEAQRKSAYNRRIEAANEKWNRAEKVLQKRLSAEANGAPVDCSPLLGDKYYMGIDEGKPKPKKEMAPETQSIQEIIRLAAESEGIFVHDVKMNVTRTTVQRGGGENDGEVIKLEELRLDGTEEEDTMEVRNRWRREDEKASGGDGRKKLTAVRRKN